MDTLLDQKMMYYGSESNKIVAKIACGFLPTKDELHNALFEICDGEHASCNEMCPVYALQNQTERESGTCACFKRGEAMAQFIRERNKTTE